MVKSKYLTLSILVVAALLFSVTVGRDMLATVFFSEQGPTVQIGSLELAVSVARTSEERKQGLSGTESLPEFAGKLFIFERSERHGFWMKEMNYPIDIFWIDESFKIVHIEENVSPDTFPKSFKPSAPARYVLETNAFMARDYSIRAGDTVFMSNAVFE